VVFNVTSYSESDGDVAAISAPTGALAGDWVLLKLRFRLEA
jgi:hypothetical protein